MSSPLHTFGTPSFRYFSSALKGNFLHDFFTLASLFLFCLVVMNTSFTPTQVLSWSRKTHFKLPLFLYSLSLHERFPFSFFLLLLLHHLKSFVFNFTLFFRPVFTCPWTWTRRTAHTVSNNKIQSRIPLRSLKSLSNTFLLFLLRSLAIHRLLLLSNVGRERCLNEERKGNINLALQR